MLAILYLCLCFLAGLALVNKLFSGIASNWMTRLPGAFLLGTLALTWATYLLSYAFRATQSPMAYGNALAMCASAGLIGLTFYLRGAVAGLSLKVPRKLTFEAGFALVALLLSSFLMFYTFRKSGTELLVGVSVWSDFGPHLALIRSFSEGNNFPTIYPHYAASGIRYHFLFQFLAGNLEFLGLPIDWAFNLPSIISFTSVMMLLYVFTQQLTGSRGAAVLANVFFFFRSSFAFLTLTGETLGRIFSNTTFIGRTNHENWGLWNQNVYLNQRHLAFALALLLLVLISVFERKEKQAPRRYSRALALGALIGLMGFWNGAVVVALLLIMAVLSLHSRTKGEFVITALVALVLVQLETRFFIGLGSAVSPRLHIGFLAEPKTLKGVLAYYVELLGLLPFVVLAAVSQASASLRWLALAALAPLVLATVLQLTPDIAMNHKFVMISVMLLNIPAAAFLCRLWQERGKVARAAIGLVIALMTCTGVIDFITIINLDAPSRVMRFNEEDPLRKWVLGNTDSRDVFLTHEYVLNPVLLSGRKLFYGWPYYAWSAGYNTPRREQVSAQIYSASDPALLKQLVAAERIDYILVDLGSRNSNRYKFDETALRKSYPIVFENKEPHYTVYKTKPD